MVFFKYLAKILQQPNLNGCFFENSENKTANAFSSIFAGSYRSYGDEWTIIMTITRWKYVHYQFHFKMEQLMKKTLNYRKYLNIFIQIKSLLLVWRHQNVVYALPKEISRIFGRKKHIFKMRRFMSFLRP